MGQLLQDYLPLVIFIGIAFVISTILLVVPFVIAVRNPDPEKVSAYECGFDAFDDARMKFDVRFYLVSLLFIIFDLEVAFLFRDVKWRILGVGNETHRQSNFDQFARGPFGCFGWRGCLTRTGGDNP